MPIWRLVAKAALVTRTQWRNSRGGGRGAECPLTLLTGKFLLTYREKRGKQKRIVKREARKKGKMDKRTLFFFFFHFSKPPKFFGGLPKIPKWEFSTGKKHFTPGKNLEKMTLHPLKNIPLTPLHVLYGNSICFMDVALTKLETRIYIFFFLREYTFFLFGIIHLTDKSTIKSVRSIKNKFMDQ